MYCTLFVSSLITITAHKTLRLNIMTDMLCRLSDALLSITEDEQGFSNHFIYSQGLIFTQCSWRSTTAPLREEMQPRILLLFHRWRHLIMSYISLQNVTSLSLQMNSNEPIWWEKKKQRGMKRIFDLDLGKLIQTVFAAMAAVFICRAVEL